MGMKASDRFMLTINGGSSSLKFAVYDAGGGARRLGGQFSGLGRPGTTLAVSGLTRGRHVEPVASASHSEALELLFEWLAQEMGTAVISAIGHRIVHGGPRYRQHCLVDEALLASLRASRPMPPSTCRPKSK